MAPAVPSPVAAVWAMAAAEPVDLVVVRDRTVVCRAAKTARELLDQCP
jgi:hypothetical protein